MLWNESFHKKLNKLRSLRVKISLKTSISDKAIFGGILSSERSELNARRVGALGSSHGVTIALVIYGKGVTYTEYIFDAESGKINIYAVWTRENAIFVKF